MKHCMFRASLSGQVRQTTLHRWRPLLPLFEAVMNSVQAVEERDRSKHRITIEIERELSLDLDDEAPIISFTVTDLGIGFDDDNFDSFNTAFSEYKVGRGGKGLGRFLWLKAFERIEIDSVFADPDNGSLLQRRFQFDVNYDPESAPATLATREWTGTILKMVGFKEPYRTTCPKTAEHIASLLVEHFLLVFLHTECPTIELHDGSTKIIVNDVFQTDFKQKASAHEFELQGQRFTLHGFRLTTPRASRHKLTYAANERGVVSDKLEDFIPNLSGRLSDEDGPSFVYLGVVQSPYLNERVNHTRTDFDIASGDDAEIDQPSLLASEIKRSDIREECLKYISNDLADVIEGINAAKAERIRQYVQDDAPHYRVLLKRQNEFIDRISPNASKGELEAALHRELHQREVELKKEGTKIITEAAKLEDYDEYRDRLSRFMEEFNELGVSALAQYVMHRKIILDFLERAISIDHSTGKYPLEKVVHDVIFPMKGTNEDILYSQQNLWILDERLNYHSFIASDKPLSSVEYMESTSQKRPDLFIFDRKIVVAEGEHPIGSVTIVEFKRPQRDDFTAADNPVDQVYQAVSDIRKGVFKDPHGRPIAVQNDHIPATCFIICDVTSKVREFLVSRDFTPMADGQGFYAYQRNFGIYCEVLDYNKILRDAKRRNRVFFERLNLLGPQ